MTFRFATKPYDALIVGARCAGAATAMLLARAGARVLLIERSPKPGDTVSTHALMRPAVTMLDRWGLLGEIVAAGTPTIHATSFAYGDDAFTIPIKPEGRAEGLYAPRRTLLDSVLRNAATRAGAELRTGWCFLRTMRDASGRVCGAEIRGPDGVIRPIYASMVIGADGTGSTVAASLKAPILRRSANRSATLYGYYDGIANTGHSWLFDDRIAAGLIPTNDGQHCIFAFCPPEDFKARFAGDPAARLARLIGRWSPNIAETMMDQGRTVRLRRFGGISGYKRACAGSGWALVGDAGYFRDPATAHGISDAFLDAQRLCNAVLRSPSDAAGYRAARDRHAVALFDVTQEIAGFGWSLDRLKALHLRLTACMKAEMADLPPTRKSRRAAA